MEEVNERDPQTFAIIGAAMEVHRELGHGFLESVYQEAMETELNLRGIPWVAQVELPIVYKGVCMSKYFIPDLICFNSVVVELKAIKALTSSDEAQLINYLKAARIERGLLFNFGSPRLEQRRRIFTPK